MQKSKLASLTAIVAILATVSTSSLAFADEEDSITQTFFERAVAEGAGVAAASGFMAGAIMPLIFVLGKFVKAALAGQKTESWDWSQFLITIASGTGVGYVGYILGLPIEATAAGVFPWLLFYIKVIHPIIRNATMKKKGASTS